MLGICRNCRGVYIDNMEKGELDFNVIILVIGLFVFFEILVLSGEEFMD